jgi:hypothetical protein
VKNGNISADANEDKMIKVRSRMALYQEICSVAGLMRRVFNLNDLPWSSFLLESNSSLCDVYI